VDDQLKLSSENIRGSAARMTPPPVLEIYDAPEKSQGRILPATDVWSLGVTVVEALTRVPPVWNRSAQGDPVAPAGIPEPYAQIARECLRREPENRCTLDEVRACLEGGAAIPHRPVKPGKSKAETMPVKAKVVDAIGALAAKPPETPVPELPAQPEAKTAVAQAMKPAPEPGTGPRRNNRWTAIGAAAAAVLVVLLVILIARSHHATQATEPPSTNEGTTSAPAQPAAESQATAPNQEPQPQPQAPPPQPEAQAPGAQPEAQPAPSQTTTAAAPAPAVTTAVAKSAGGPAAKGAVAQQVMPDVPEKASHTIHGTVKASIEVSVDANGAVSNAAIDSQGPSRYFANLALEAARSWKFTPAQVNGQSVPSVWVLHFAFKEAGTEVTPTEQTP
jgi:TonB family protein